MNLKKSARLLPLLVIAQMVLSQSVYACATCFGKSDSKLAEGMNWGIFVLLLVVVGVLVGISTFFVFIARRAAAQKSTYPQ